MNVLQVSYHDLIGRRFDGFDLHLALKESGIQAIQIVMDKRSHENSVIQLKRDVILENQIRIKEREYSISHLLHPFGTELENHRVFQEAEIVHYHILHDMISLLDYPRLMNQKKSVWTIHDPWIFTGNCIYPLECAKWQTGCGDCEALGEEHFSMEMDNTAFMWKLKKDLFLKINPDVVVASNFTANYLKKSPLTQHFTKIHIIPFGLNIHHYKLERRVESRKKLFIPECAFVIGFRMVNSMRAKGNRYIYEALSKLENTQNIILLTVGGSGLPDELSQRFRTIQFGWVDDSKKLQEFYGACDLFLMPSLAETFGLMAIEAMAAGCAVLCFKGTVLEEITDAPRCGIAVAYCSSEAIASEIVHLIDNKGCVGKRGRQGHELVKKKYLFENYVTQHLKLYEHIRGKEE